MIKESFQNISGSSNFQEVSREDVKKETINCNVKKNPQLTGLFQRQL